MNNDVLAAIIGGLATLTGVIVSPIVSKFIENKSFYPISRDRRKKMAGKWKGKVNQYEKDVITRSIEVELDLTIKGKEVRGTGMVNSEGLHQVSLKGFFRNDRFLKMDYQNDDESVVQFGCFVFGLGDDSKSLTGKFVGYGHVARKIVNGECHFEKSL
jgi:hypothetical protein